MPKVKGLKRTQIQGKKYDLPVEEITIQKLIRKGAGLNTKIKALKQELDSVKGQLIKIAENRRKDATTVKLQGVSGHSVITFRESYVCDNRVEETAPEIGSLFERFFERQRGFKTTKDLKQFLDGKQTFGVENAEGVKKLLLPHVTKKSTKPNVKIVGAE